MQRRRAAGLAGLLVLAIVPGTATKCGGARRTAALIRRKYPPDRQPTHDGLARSPSRTGRSGIPPGCSRTPGQVANVRSFAWMYRLHRVAAVRAFGISCLLAGFYRFRVRSTLLNQPRIGELLLPST